MQAPNITILWSTQGGRAKACARRTARILTESNSAISSQIPGGYYGSSFDDYGPIDFFKLGSESVSDGKRRLVILFVSTTGDAEQCDSISNTWKMILQKSVPTDQFMNIQFAMFCLGDRAYGPSAFCAAGRKLAARLVQLSAKPFCQIGYGDDGSPNGGVFSDLDVWLEKVLLEKFLGARSNQSVDFDQDSLTELPESPYCAKKRSIRNNDRKLKEWQNRQFRDSYNGFFSSLCPATAYNYDDCRIHVSEENSVEDDPHRRDPLLGCVVSNERITGKGWMQDTRHIKMHITTRVPNRRDVAPLDPAISLANSKGERKDVSNTEEIGDTANKPLPYVAGDIATIMPSNPKSTVDRFISCLPASIQADADLPIEISTRIDTATQYSSSFTKWPKYATLRGILTYCADISNLPEREDLRSLRFYCNPSHPAGCDQRKKLYSLSETADTALYGDYVLREKRSWADILFDFDSIKFEDGGEPKMEAKIDVPPSYLLLTIEHLLMILPPIMPRHFSIASSPTANVDHSNDIEGYSIRNGALGFNLELCVAVVKGSTRYGRQYQGLCSSYLSSLKASDQLQIRAWIRPGSFHRLPLELNVDRIFKSPVMYVGAGTGCAPLRSLILEREAVRSKALSTSPMSKDKNHPPDNILVFGCRKSTMDYYYCSEWKKLEIIGNLRVLNAFSQDQKHKLYVQKVVREADEGLLIAKHLLEDNGCLYIAGGAKMARAVKDEVIECIGKVLPSGEKGAKILLQKLQRAGKFSVEAWS